MRQVIGRLTDRDHFDDVLFEEATRTEWARERPDLAADVDYKGKGRHPSRRPVKVPVKVMACGGGDQHLTDEQAALAEQ